MDTRNFFVGMSKLHGIAQDPTDKQKIEAIAGIAAGAMFEGVQPTTPAAKFMNYLGMCESQAKTPQDVAAINLVRGRVMLESAAEAAGEGGEGRTDVNEVIKKPVEQIVAILNANKDNAKLIINTAFKNYQAGVKQAAADAKKAEKEQKVAAQNEADQKTIDANKSRTDKVKDIKGRQAAEAKPAVDENKIKADAVAEITEKFKKARPELFGNDGNPKDESTTKIIEDRASQLAAKRIKEAGSAKPEVDEDLAALDKAEIAKNTVGIKDRAKSLAAHTRQALRQNKGFGSKLAGVFRGAKQALLGEGIDQALVAKLSGPEAIALCESAGIKVPALI